MILICKKKQKELFRNMKDVEPVVVIELLNNDGSIFDRSTLVAGHLRSHIRGLVGHKTIPTVVLTMNVPMEKVKCISNRI